MKFKVGDTVYWNLPPNVGGIQLAQILSMEDGYGITKQVIFYVKTLTGYSGYTTSQYIKHIEQPDDILKTIL